MRTRARLARAWFFAFGVLASVLASTQARAEPAQRVALVGHDPELRAALDVALAAWEVEIVDADSPGPGATMPIAANDAEALAKRTSTDAVVWISTAPGGAYAVWIYDARARHTSSRALRSPPPFDAPSAAAVALSVKTLLRSSSVAPPTERFGATAAVAASATTPPSWWVGTALGARALASDIASIEPRGGVSVAWYPRGATFGVALTSLTGTGLRVDSDRLSGKVTSSEVGVSLRARLPFAAKLSVEPRVGASVHVVSLRGVLPATLASVDVTRVDTSIDAGALVAWRVATYLEIGASGIASYYARYQRFLVDAQPIFALSPLDATLALELRVGLP